MKSKKLIAILLAIMLLLQTVSILSTSATTQTETESAVVSNGLNGEGVWLTEIYNNDVDRSKANDTRVADGYQKINLFEGTTDLMEFIEVVSTHKSDIKLNDLYSIYYGGTYLNITDMNGSSDITLKRGQSVVIWNYRSDVSFTPPTEKNFRRQMRVPDSALLLKTECGVNWDGSSATFKIKSNSTGKNVSKATVTKGVEIDDGLSVDLMVPDEGRIMDVYRKLTIPSPGYTYSGQLNNTIPAYVPNSVETDGVFISEIYANDIDRSATYGTTSDLMECIEVVNTNPYDIDLNNDYQVYYVVKEGQRKILELHHHDTDYDNNIGSKSDCIVPAGGTAILWCYRRTLLTDYTSFPSLKKFRTALNIDSSVPVYIFPNQNSLSNTNRTFEVYKNNSDGTKTLTSSYSYLGDGTDIDDGKSVHLQPNPEWPKMFIQDACTDTSLGTVKAVQTEYRDDGKGVSVTLDKSLSPYLLQGKELRVSFKYKQEGNNSCKSLTTYYRIDGDEWKESNPRKKGRAPGYYEAIVTADELFNAAYVEFYVETTTKFRAIRSDLYKINIVGLNSFSGVRTNIAEGDIVKGIKTFTANDGSNNLNTKMYIDGTSKSLSPVLEDGAYFTFKILEREKYYYSAITTTDNEEIASVTWWHEQISDGQAVKVDSSYFDYKSGNNLYRLDLRVWAGTRGSTAENTLMPDAGRDRFKLKNLALRLPNGNTYYPSSIGPDNSATNAATNLSTEYSAVHMVGNYANASNYIDITFKIPASEVDAMGTTIDTTTLTDGKHTITVTDGTSTSTANFIVDNTKPSINSGITANSTLTGNITIDPKATDISKITNLVVELDGKKISTPYNTSAYKLGEGAHTLSVIATDAAGNERESVTNFNVSNVDIKVKNGGTTDITNKNASLYLTVENRAENGQATFYKAERIDSENITVTEGDGIIPYLQYTINVGNLAKTDNIIANWDGTASNSDSKHASKMYVLNTSTNKWDLVATADDNGSIDKASFVAENHIKNGKATLLVQCTATDASPDLDPATDGVTGTNSGWDGTTVPNSYDFCFAWQTDTQYYAEGYQHHFLNMNQWIVDNAENWKIKYVINTGDIVDDFYYDYQWENADQAMKIFDDAKMPYGVLAGNHDVGSAMGNYESYYKYFNKERFNTNNWYGTSYKNNKGHYDLISENGQDFIIVYMSWNIFEEEINWMNKVLKNHSDRKAILCFHGYTRSTYVSEGDTTLLDYWGKLIQKYVVKENPNVFAVLNGHYHGSSYETVKFDDDGGGTKERTVYQLCTDYQSGFEGGSEYIKFLYFDLDNNKIFLNSYSPYLNDFNYYDTPVVNLSQDGGAIGIDSDPMYIKIKFDKTKHTLNSTQFSAYVCTNNELGTATMDSSTKKINLELNNLEPETKYLWYAKITDENTGYLQTEFYEFTTTKRLLGDVDDNGVVNVSDATLVQKITVGLEQATDDTLTYGDVDGDGKLNIRDATYIQKYIIKAIDKFPALV